MKHHNAIYKRIFLYVGGLFLLSLGITFSILAGIGVSPGSALAYAVALITPLSVGVTTVLSNILYIIVQAFLQKAIYWKDFFIQLIVAFLFGFFIDLTLWLTQGLPEANSIAIIVIYMFISLFLVAFGLLLYFTSGLPTMPYDALTYVISDTQKMVFGKAKITTDVLNVVISLLLSFLFIRSFGSVGIGTLVAAYGVGKILGIFIHKFQPAIKKWALQND